MMKAVLIDDEKGSINVLQKLLKLQSIPVEVIGTANSITEGKAVIDLNKPDVVFLDIKMPGGDGFELLKNLGQIDFEVIFTTAHSEYVLAAMRCGAIDYLLKPIDHEELHNALNRINSKTAKIKAATATDYQSMIELISAQFNKNKMIPIATLSGVDFINSSEILRCSADNNYTKIHLKGGKLIIASKTLKDYEILLENSGFFRCHRSHLINIECVSNYKKGKKAMITMNDGFSVELSQNKRNQFFEIFS